MPSEVNAFIREKRSVCPKELTQDSQEDRRGVGDVVHQFVQGGRLFSPAAAPSAAANTTTLSFAIAATNTVGPLPAALLP